MHGVEGQRRGVKRRLKSEAIGDAATLQEMPASRL